MKDVDKGALIVIARVNKRNGLIERHDSKLAPRFRW
jgi:hypothetical protein